MRGLLIRAAIGAAVIILGFVVTAVVLNQTVYTPAAFVQTYLDAIARHDAAAARAMAGPTPSNGSSDVLLNAQVMTELDETTVTETGSTGGVHTVAVD